MRTQLKAGLAVLAAAALAGCGTVIDDSKLEAEVEKDAEAAGIVVDAVDCPSPDAEEGATFTCSVTVKGEKREIEVEQRDDEGSVTYSLDPLLEDFVPPDAEG